jgi:hypothetical protein
LALRVRLFLILAGLVAPLCLAAAPASQAEEAAADATAAEGTQVNAASEPDAPVLNEGLITNEAEVIAEPETEYPIGGEPKEPAPSRFPAASSFDTGFAYQFASDVADGGDFHLWQAWVDGVYDVEMTPLFSVVARFDYNADDYHFEDTPDVNGFPLLQWGLISSLRFDPLFAFDIHDDWRIFVGPDLEFSFETGANIREAFTPGGLAAVEWTVNDDLRVGLGVIAIADLDSKAYVSPILLLDWNLSESLAVHMESWSTRGGEIELGWRAIDQLELAASIGYRRELYRLNQRDDGVQPPGIPTPLEISDGLAQDRAYNAALRVSWLPQFDFVQNTFGDLRIDLDVAAVFAGKLKVDDSTDATLSEQDYDATPAIGLSFYVPL